MMSDGALSQDEIDALLAGVDSSAGGGGAPAATATAAPSGANFDAAALEKFFSSTTGALSSNLSALTGASVSMIGPEVDAQNRDNFLSVLPSMVTVVTANYTSGFPGEHIFIFPEESAKAIASLMTKEEDIQLDDMAMSVIGEVVSQMVGTQITSLTDKTGNKSIAAASPTAANVPKATAALPAGDFAVMTYQVNLGDTSIQMWEILGSSPAGDISHGLNGGSKQAPSAGQMPGMQMPGMQMPGMGGMGMQNMGMGMGMPGMGMGMPGMGMGMGGMPNLGPTNVQPVQFPNLMPPRLGPQESGNIGLIMDVSMEMTVELGRTRKLIKEILGMGEGTIIELDKLAGEPVDILVNHKLIAKGEVVVIDENFGVRVTEIVSPMERLNDLA
jgi:flagellar motor switch protein FliN/FliY